jgi:predicted DNA-binding protein (MmcQ/YjbR family)
MTTELEQLRAALLARPGAYEDFPFGPDPLVIKVGGKMFALVSLGAAPLSLALKCDPAHAEMLRAAYPAIQPGYHLNKRHWNTILLDGSVPAETLQALIAESYDLVVRGLPRAARQELAGPG